MRLRFMLAVGLLLPCATLAPALANDADLAARRTPVVAAVEKARLSVVNIRANRIILRRASDPYFGPSDEFFDRMFEDFFGGRYTREEIEAPLGSGVILDEAGFVLTNEHVVRRAAKMRISLADNAVYDAELLCADPANDIALLKIVSAGKFQPIALGTSADLMLGETAIALGNPFGFENSVSTGVISALHRNITAGQSDGGRQYKDLIQTSALINPGNSGGALLNINGELIGVNTAVVSGAQGIGFALPVDIAVNTLAELFANPRVTAIWFGAKIAAPANGPGALVQSVEKDSPAAGAGLKTGDLIVAAAGKPVNAFALQHLLALAAPGALELEARRDGAQILLRVELVARPKLSPRKKLENALGISGQNVTADLSRALRLAIEDGVLVAAVAKDSPAEEVGVKTNDIIIQISNSRVRNLEEAAAALEGLVSGQQVYIRVIRGNFLAGVMINIR